MIALVSRYAASPPQRIPNIAPRFNGAWSMAGAVSQGVACPAVGLQPSQ